MARRFPSTSLLAGQLRYLFEERPELRTADAEQLRDRLSTEDRYARARARYPRATGEEIQRRIAEFDDRIMLDAVREARAFVGRPNKPGRPGRGETGTKRDETPLWSFLAAVLVLMAGIVAWIVELARYGPTRATWTGGALIGLMGLAIGGAISAHRHANP